jgi:NitT/TauT family transport system permease protein
MSALSPELFPNPTRILHALCGLVIDGSLLKHCVASLFRVTAGFYLAIVTAVPLGILLGRNRTLYRITNPVIQFLRPISPLAWAPFAILWFGIGDLPAIFIIFLASFFPLLIAAIDATATIPAMYFQVGANLQLSRRQSFTNIILPAIVPNVILAMRVTLGVAWVVVVAAEMIGMKSGLGFLIVDGRDALRLDRVAAAMVVIGLIGLVLDRIMQGLAKLELVRWKIVQK